MKETQLVKCFPARISFLLFSRDGLVTVPCWSFQKLTCVSRSRFAEMLMNSSYQSSHLWGLWQDVHVDDGYLYRICKSNFVFFFPKEGPQNVLSFRPPKSWLCLSGLCDEGCLGSKGEGATQVSARSETWTLRVYVGRMEAGVSLNVARHRCRVLCLPDDPDTFFLWAFVSFSLHSLLTAYVIPRTISLSHPFSLTVRSSPLRVQAACGSLQLPQPLPTLSDSAPLAACPALFVVPSSHSCRREADRPTLVFLTFHLSDGLWAALGFTFFASGATL